MDAKHKAIVENVKELITAISDTRGRKLTQAEIAEAGFGGESRQSYVSAILAGHRTPNRAVVMNFARALGVSPKEIDPEYKPVKQVSVPDHLLYPQDSKGEYFDPKLVEAIEGVLDEFQELQNTELPPRVRTQLKARLHQNNRGKDYSSSSMLRQTLSILVQIADGE